MDCRIVLWDSDTALREALFRRLFRKGFLPVSLGDPGKLSKVVRLLGAELVLFEANWERGATVRFQDSFRADQPEEDLSLVMPLPVFGAVGGDTHGLVVGKLRKPFGTRELIGGIGAALEMRRRLERRSPGVREWLEVKPLTRADEIEAALRLRLEVYRETGFINSARHGIEHDSYDPFSTIFGAFHNQGDRRELAGTIRIIHHGKAEAVEPAELVRAVRRHKPDFSLEACVETPELPSLETFGLQAHQLRIHHAGFGGILSESGRVVGREICELSRLAIAPAYRRSRFGIERKLFQMIVIDSCGSERRPRNWFTIAVHPSRRAKFERFGFRTLQNLGVRPYAGLNQPAILMTLDLQHYLTTPNPFSESLDLELLLYQAGGYLSHSLEENQFPACRPD